MSEVTTLGVLEAERVHAATGVRISPDAATRTEMERLLVRTWDGQRAAWDGTGCKVCAAPFVCEAIERNGFSLAVNVCEQCGPMVTAHYSCDREEQRVTQTPWWDDYCPLSYRELITGQRLPDVVDRQHYERVLRWTASHERGMVLTGPSGIGKTLSMWALARDLEKAGVRPLFFSAVEFARKLATAARDLEKAEWLMSARVLMIDDLGKEKLSSAVAALVWEVVDARVNNRRPTIVSTRFRASEFVARFADPVLGEDIRGRIADGSEHIVFGDKAGKKAA